MGMFTTLAIGAMGAYSAIAQGNAANAEAKYNAKVLTQQADNIDIAKSLESYQADRAIRKTQGTLISSVAKNGLELSGSPLAVLVDTMTQMEMDKSIGQYNLEAQKSYLQMEAKQTLVKGKNAMTAGYVGGFTKALTAASEASLKYGVRTPKTGTPKPNSTPTASLYEKQRGISPSQIYKNI